MSRSTKDNIYVKSSDSIGAFFLKRRRNRNVVSTRTTKKLHIRTPSANRKECFICLDTFNHLTEGTTLQNCGHCVHTECLQDGIIHQINEKKKTICPLPNCTKKPEICQNDVRKLLTSDENKKLYEKYLQSTLERHIFQNERLRYCLNPSCNFAFELPSGETNYHCTRCNFSYCVTCGVPIHNGISCEEYQKRNSYKLLLTTPTTEREDRKTLEYMKLRGMKRCPNCGEGFERVSGCDHFKCCKCEYEFCYRCGGRYKHCECTRHARERRERERQEQIQREEELEAQNIRSYNILNNQSLNNRRIRSINRNRNNRNNNNNGTRTFRRVRSISTTQFPRVKRVTGTYNNYDYLRTGKSRRTNNNSRW